MSPKVANASPSLFPLTPCDPGSGDTVTLGCLAQDFFPKSATFQWTSTSNSNTQVDSQQFIFPQPNVNKFTGVSVISVPRSKALSYNCSLTHPAGNKNVKAVYTCDVTHAGQNYIKKASKGTVQCVLLLLLETSLTVTLNPPNPKAMFVSKRAELKCVVTGPDSSIVSKTKIQWYIDEHNKCTNTTYMFVIKMIILISVFQFEICIFHINCKSLLGKGTSTVEVLTPSTITGDSVTLVCLVTSTVLQDYYIAWSEASGHDIGTYHDGLNLPPQKINSVYLVSSFYTISKDKWSKNKFSCNVWPAGTTFTSASIGMSPSIK
uniref:Ig-like domain-containing protein n=1 Tax=Poecilia mexicana TaxID=48701 RepID=A0A3B3Y4P7_9TELE